MHASKNNDAEMEIQNPRNLNFENGAQKDMTDIQYSRPSAGGLSVGGFDNFFFEKRNSLKI